MSKFTDERVSAVIRGIKAMRTIEFPGLEKKGISVSIRVLAESELDDCRIAAQKYIRDRAKKRGWEVVEFQDVDPTIMQRMVERQIIWRAYFDSETINEENPHPFFSSYNEVAELDSVTVMNLMATYLEHQEWVNPSRRLTEEEVEELVEQLGKAPSVGVALNVLEESTLRKFAVSLVCLLRSMQPDGSSSTSSTP